MILQEKVQHMIDQVPQIMTLNCLIQVFQKHLLVAEEQKATVMTIESPWQLKSRVYTMWSRKKKQLMQKTNFSPKSTCTESMSSYLLCNMPRITHKKQTRHGAHKGHNVLTSTTRKWNHRKNCHFLHLSGSKPISTSTHQLKQAFNRHN